MTEEVKLLHDFDTPTICNVIEMFEVRPRAQGYMDGHIKAEFPRFPPMVGFAVTATFRASRPPEGKDVYAYLDQQIAAFEPIPEPRVVVFQDLDDQPVAATFGEITCSAYQRFGCSGVITSGAGRDLDQIEALGLPVFSSQTICDHGYFHLVEMNIPVTVGGVVVQPGDLLHGDRNGVTVVPSEVIPFLAEGCKEYLEAEKEMLSKMSSEHLDLPSLRKAQDDIVERLDELKSRLQRKLTGS